MAVGTSNYPTSLDTVVELIQAANNAQTTLNGALTANATTVAVISTALFANTGCFAVDNELISYTGKTATSFTGCVRGFDGTTAATHSSGATVSDVVTTRHHEVVVDAILAIQERLGAGTVLPLAKGGTGVALTDPNADRILFWDDSAGAMAFLTAGTGLTITGTTIETTGAGTVTSVGLSLPAMFTVTNSPVISSGTLTATLATQAANAVLVGPINAPNAAPTFRQLEDEDIPNVLSIHKNKHLTTNGFVKTTGGDGTLSVDTATYLTTTGTFSTGGTLGGVTVTLGSDATGDIYYRNSGGVLTRLGIGTSAQVLTVSGGGLPSWATPTATAAGSTGDYQINSSNAFAAGVLSQSAGRLTSTATAVSSGVTPYLRLITPTDTGLTASTEAPGIVFGGDASGATVTRTRAAGAVTTQREYIFTAPTYAAASATTITTAATLAITGAPVAGSNVTITNAYGLLVNTGSATAGSRFVSNNTFSHADTKANPYQLQLETQKSDGGCGIQFLTTDGQVGALYYSRTENNFLFAFSSGQTGSAGARRIIFGEPQGSYLTIGGSDDMGGVSLGALPTSEARLYLRSNNALGTTNNGLRVEMSTSATGNGIEMRRSTTQRYHVFADANETRVRLFGENAGQQTRAMLSELVTLSTVGATTDTTIQIPANSLVLGVTVRVTTTIAGIDSTALQIGDATTAARFGSIAAFTAGTTGVGLSHLQGGISTDAAGPIVTSATAVRLTLSGGADNTPSAGAVRVTIHYISLTAPTS